MPAGLSPALLKAMERWSKGLNWPNKPRAGYLQMP